MLFPHYTLHGWKYDIKDPYNSAFVLAMKARLRNSLPAMQARLQGVLEDSFRRLMRGKTDPDGMSLFSSKAHMLADSCRLDQSFSIHIRIHGGGGYEYRYYIGW